MFYFKYKTETTEELLKIVRDLNFKGFEQYFKRNTNGDFNHLQNFFIWKKKEKGNSEYLRITLLSNNLRNEELLFYWNLETSFKPFAYKHNHREKANIQSKTFKPNDNKNYLIEFLNIVKEAKDIIK